jgi:dephospho-CoA kinase
MTVIGLTGNIGSGKTLAASYLADLGAVMINADEIGHRILDRSSPAYHGVIETFGEEYLLPDGNIDRVKLGKLVFAQPEELDKLNAISHHRLKEEAKARIEVAKAAGATHIVLEAAILIQAGFTDLVDQIWLIEAGQKQIYHRLDKIFNKVEIKNRIAAQMTPEEMRKYADVIILNDSTVEELKQKIHMEYQKLGDI